MDKNKLLAIMECHQHCKFHTAVADKVSIIQSHGHYVAYVDGQFYCSGDTYLEVVQELSNDGIV